jgi:hypothetical protein
VEYRYESGPSGASRPTAIAIWIKVTSKATSNGLNADDERVMTSQVGSAEEIGKLWRLQELVDLSTRAISNRISSGSCTLVSVAGFDDPALRLFAKPVTASLFEAKVDRAVSCSTSKLPAKPRLFYHRPRSGRSTVQRRPQNLPGASVERGDGYIYAATWSLAPTSSL